MSDMIGRRLGDYEINGLLGRGGMATVYRARQLSVERDVAIKIIKPDVSSSTSLEEFIARFKREAQTIAKLSHPHILKLFDYGQSDELIYLVTELLPGGTLADQIRQQRLTPAEATTYIDQIAKALDYAHKRGIVHRDLKPQNVLFDEDGNAFLTDFGIAKVLNAATSLTNTGTAMGTPAYMPPEQWQNLALDARADVYALGIMVFEMLTGKLPFNADTPFQMMYAHVNETPLSVRGVRGDLPDNIEAVIAKALSKNREDRYQSAGAFAEAFRITLSGTFSIPQAPEITTTLPPEAQGESSSAEEVFDFPMRGGGRIPLIVGVIGILAVFGIVVILSGRDGGSGATTATGTEHPTSAASLTMRVAAIQPSEPPTATPTATPTETGTPLPIPTATILPTVTVDSTAPIATQQAMATQTVVNQTQTAIGWTATPTILPSLTATFTFTHTALPTLTSAATFTPTLTATFTSTFTATPTETFTATATHTATTLATITPLPTATPYFSVGRSHAEWTPMQRTVGGVPMAYVPAGCFLMGSSDAQIDAAVALIKPFFPRVSRESFTDELPHHEVCFNAPFWIDLYEVTNAQFATFGGKAGRASAAVGDDFPRESITWLEARDFCAARGARLPTEAEWEYAARGSEGWVFPWGETFDGSRLNYCDALCANTWKDSTVDDGFAGIAPVGRYPSGISWVGTYDQSGNVWEWVSTIYRPYPYTPADGREGLLELVEPRSLRGGSWLNAGGDTRAALRNRAATREVSEDVGFRCARDF